MKKVFLATLIALLVSLQSFCGAATVETAHWDGNSELEYPIIYTGDADVDRKINSEIINRVKRFVNECYQRVEQENAENKFANEEIRFLNVHFEVPCNEADNSSILSVKIGEAVTYKLPPHPYYYTETLNFNVKTGELLNLDYLKTFGNKYSVENVSNKLVEYINSCPDPDVFKKDEIPLKKLPEQFYFDENMHVHFVFPIGTIAHTAVGFVDLDMDD